MKKKIMFVDDKSDQLFSFEQVLKESGYHFEFIGVQTGEECLKKLQHAELPDIIFLDIMMGEMNGCEVYDKIKDNPAWKEIPIVFLTARKDMLDKIPRECCGDDVLEKPVDSTELFDCINKIIEKNKKE